MIAAGSRPLVIRIRKRHDQFLMLRNVVAERAQQYVANHDSRICEKQNASRFSVNHFRGVPRLDRIGAGRFDLQAAVSLCR